MLSAICYAPFALRRAENVNITPDPKLSLAVGDAGVLNSPLVLEVKDGDRRSHL